jgi:prophage maintenance system killer protein
MHYLTIQDMIWISMQVTKKTQSFNYAKLEEATFYQYAYGHSTSILAQAGRFLSGFAQKKPFAQGSEATAFIGCVAFLKLNGMTINLSDDTAHHWIERSVRDSSAAMEALTDIAVPDETYHADKEPNVRDVLYDVLDAYPKTLLLLSTRSSHLVGV